MVRRVYLISGAAVLLASSSFADVPSVIVRPAANLPKKAASPIAVGKPIGIAPMLSLTVAPESQTVAVGDPATYTIKVNAVGITAPAALSVQMNPARPYTLTPNPVAPGATATLVFPTAPTDAIGSVPFAVSASSGAHNSTRSATLTLTDPPCGTGPVSLSWAITGLSFQFMTGPPQTPGVATVRMQLMNTGGRINQTTPKVRVFTVGFNCQYGNCILGPVPPGSPNPGMMTFDGRGGCARLVWSGEVPARSLIPKSSCINNPSWKFNMLAQVDLAGIAEATGKGTEFGCAAAQ